MWLASLFLFLFSFYFFEKVEYTPFFSYLKKENKPIEEKKTIEEEVIKKEQKYEDKYLEKSRQLNRSELSLDQLKKLKNNVLFEKTPIGNVLMFYNHEKESFSYYSDFNIPYRYLETIGRKYIITFHCASLYVFVEEELEKLSLVQQEVKESVKDSNTSSVFAKFKNYNKNNSMSTTLSQPLKQHKNQPINLRKIPIKEKANRYTYEGKLSNYSFLKKILPKDTNKHLQISYSDYKNKFI